MTTTTVKAPFADAPTLDDLAAARYTGNAEAIAAVTDELLDVVLAELRRRAVCEAPTTPPTNWPTCNAVIDHVLRYANGEATDTLTFEPHFVDQVLAAKFGCRGCRNQRLLARLKGPPSHT